MLYSKQYQKEMVWL